MGKDTYDWNQYPYSIYLGIYSFLTAVLTVGFIILRNKEPIRKRKWFLAVVSQLAALIVVILICLRQQRNINIPCLAFLVVTQLSLMIYSCCYLIRAKWLQTEWEWNKKLLRNRKTDMDTIKAIRGINELDDPKLLVDNSNLFIMRRKQLIGIVCFLIIFFLLIVAIVIAELSILHYFEEGISWSRIEECKHKQASWILYVIACIMNFIILIYSAVVAFPIYDHYLWALEYKLQFFNWTINGFLFMLFSVIPGLNRLDSVFPANTFILFGAGLSLIISLLMPVVVRLTSYKYKVQANHRLFDDLSYNPDSNEPINTLTEMIIIKEHDSSSSHVTENQSKLNISEESSYTEHNLDKEEPSPESSERIRSHKTIVLESIGNTSHLLMLLDESTRWMENLIFCFLYDYIHGYEWAGNEGDKQTRISMFLYKKYISPVSSVTGGSLSSYTTYEVISELRKNYKGSIFTHDSFNSLVEHLCEHIYSRYICTGKVTTNNSHLFRSKRPKNFTDTHGLF